MSFFQAYLLCAENVEGSKKNIFVCLLGASEGEFAPKSSNRYRYPKVTKGKTWEDIRT